MGRGLRHNSRINDILNVRMVKFKKYFSYLNASIVICGAVCLIRTVGQILFQLQDWNKPMMVPGLNFMIDLCYPILFTWIGLLIRGTHKESKWWIQLIVATISVICLIRYCSWTADHWFSIHLDATMLGLGYLIPSAELKEDEKSSGLLKLIMLIISVFCFTAVLVIKQRLSFGDVMPDHPNMESLLEALARITEPLLAILSAYFVIHLSFSSYAQTIGAIKWIRIFTLVVCLYSFLLSLRFVLITLFRWQYMAGYVYYYPLTFVLAQPITIYLIYVASRIISEKSRPKEDKLNWKECFNIFKDEKNI